MKRPSYTCCTSAMASVEARVAAYEWPALASELDNYGCTVLPKLLSRQECCTITDLYPDDNHFRSHIDMAPCGFGKGEYGYFNTRFRPFSPLYGQGSIRTSRP